MEYLIGIIIVVLYWVFTSITFKYMFKDEYLKVKKNYFDLDVVVIFIISLFFWWILIPVVLFGLFCRYVIIKGNVNLFDECCYLLYKCYVHILKILKE